MESRWVGTRFGTAHVLVEGPPGGRALVLLHGAASSAVDLAETLGWIGRGCRRYFVDLPGEPGRSADARLPKSGPSYGLWMGDVLDGLEERSVGMFGVSLGGLVALKSASAMPGRLTRVALLVPEGLATPRWVRFIRTVTVPAILYGFSPTEANCHRFVRALGTPRHAIPPGFLAQMAHAMRHVRLPPGPGPLVGAEELEGLGAPVLVIAGGRDVLFPGDRVARRAASVIPSLEETLVVPDAGHVFFPTPGSTAGRRLQGFLSPPAPRR